MVAVCILWPQVLVWPFASDPALIAAASSFLRIVAVGYLPTMATLLYAALLRSDKVVKLAMYAGVVAVVLNLVLDYLLIFGMFGAPRWGLEGAGVATTLARYVEFAVILVVSYRTPADLYALSPDTGQMAGVCLLVFSGFLFVKVANMVLGSVLNSGGDSRFILVMESSATWFVGVPLAIIAAFVLRLPIGWVYFLLSIEELPRLVVGYGRFRSGTWARNLAVPADEADEADPVYNPV